MQDAVIVSAVRTPVGSFAGDFKDVPATELGAHAVRAALERAGISGDEVEEVVLGCVLQAGLGQNPARQSAIAAGIPKEVPSTTINMLCGSGLKSVAIASQMIRAGDVDVVVAGGMENMTRAPYLLPAARFGARMGDAELVDSMVHDGLWDAFNDIHMGVTAENLADQYGIGREEQDEFAASQPAEGRAGGRRAGSSRTRSCRSRCRPRAARGWSTTTSTRGLARRPRGWRKLRAAFRGDGGTVTAGNASGVNDGAAAIVVMSARQAQERGLRTFGTVESYASVGVEPRIMGIGPVPAVRKALERAGLELSDIDLFELNEAFAAQSLAVLRELDIDARENQPPRRGDRARTSDRGQRRPDPRHPAARDAAPPSRARPRDPLRGRRPRTGGGHPQRGERRPRRVARRSGASSLPAGRSAVPQCVPDGVGWQTPWVGSDGCGASALLGRGRTEALRSGCRVPGLRRYFVRPCRCRRRRCCARRRRVGDREAPWPRRRCSAPHGCRGRTSGLAATTRSSDQLLKRTATSRLRPIRTAGRRSRMPWVSSASDGWPPPIAGVRGHRRSRNWRWRPSSRSGLQRPVWI